MLITDLDISKSLLDVVPTAMRSIRQEMRHSASFALTVPQFRTIVRLSRSRATNQELAEWMGVSAPTRSRMVQILVKRELVVRGNRGKDRREVKIILTKKGRAAYRQFRGLVQKKVSDLIARLDVSRKETLAEGLKVLKEIFP